MKLNLSRRVILLVGPSGSGKSYSIAYLAKLCQEQGKRIVIVDRDRGLEQAIAEVGADPQLIDYRLADGWERVDETMADVMGDNRLVYQPLGEGDWLVFEGLGRLWDLAQQYYSQQVYGHDPARHLMDLRIDAEQRIAAGETGDKTATQLRQAAGAYSGFEGRTEWSVIKLIHNDRVFDRAILGGEFNILSTANAEPLAQNDTTPENPLKALGMKPDGEKGHAKRHYTIVYCQQQQGKYTWRTDMGGAGKDRGKPLFKPVDMTGVGFVQSYLRAIGGVI